MGLIFSLFLLIRMINRVFTKNLENEEFVLVSIWIFGTLFLVLIFYIIGNYVDFIVSKTDEKIFGEKMHGL